MPAFVYQASAGSGKTFALVKEYLKIVINNPSDYRHVLAITFTNKATEEMKERIIRELRTMAAPDTPSSDMEQAIAEALQMPAAQVRRHAREALARLLHDYSRFEVCTIDSFFSRLIHSFAAEFQLPLNYRLDIEQLDALQAGIKKMYEDLQQNTAVLDWLENFVLDRMQESKGWHIDGAISTMGTQLFTEDFFKFLMEGGLTLEELKHWIKNTKVANAHFEQTLLNYAQEAKTLLQQQNLSPKDLLNHSFNWFESNIPQKKYPPNQTFIDIINGEKKWYAKTAKRLQDILAIEEQLDSIAQNAYRYYQEHHRAYYSNAEVLYNIYTYGLLGILNENLKHYRDENNLLLISDTGFLLRSVINDNDAPFVMDKMGSYFKHILIDEFQDTSDVQWKNLLPLIKNVLSEDNLALMVGDVKQSIYRWRGGNMHLLLNKIYEDLKHFQPKQVQLAENYRTRHDIVHFNNDFFSAALDILIAQEQEQPEIQSLLEKAYKNLAQKPAKKDGEGGYVEMRFLTQDNSPAKELSDKGGSSDADDSERIANDPATTHLLAAIQQAMADGYNYSDILILVDTNFQALLVAPVLVQQHIPFISGNSMLLDNSVYVKCVVNLLRYLHRRDDALAYTALLWQWREIQQLPVSEPQLLFSDAATDRQLFAQWLPSALVQHFDSLYSKNLFECITQLYHYLGFDALNDPYLLQLSELALTKTQESKMQLGDFLKWYGEQENRLSVLTPSKMEAVRIMTVHKAKGLEAPIVIFPYANIPFSPKSGKLLWVQPPADADWESFDILPVKYTKNLENTHFKKAYHEERSGHLMERFNVAYVALTRPIDRLYVFFTFKKQLLKINENITNFGMLAQQAVQQKYGASPHYDPMLQVLKIGSFQPKALANTADTAANEIVLQDGTVYTAERPLSLREDVADYLQLLGDERGERIGQGLQTHQILKQLQHYSELEWVLRTEQDAGLLSQERRTAIAQQLRNMFGNEQLQHLFSGEWQALSGRTLMVKGKAYRPDRVLFKEHEAILIDYQQQEQSERHRRHIRRYARWLKTMGYSVQAAYIIYTESGEMLSVGIG
ncbi:MAG: UvrD-helicase domain-containing protein [Sphingobacteriales bacterium]|nr:UvrD-helicase domain-containing protein [Sphingobacteriales bacterium]